MLQLSLFEARPTQPPPRLGFARVRTLEKSQLLTPGVGSTKDFDYTLNPYIGCGFGCTYCFAANFVADEARKQDWGNWIDVKANSLDYLRKKDLRGKHIFMSSATDPYQPLEAQMKLTRRIVEILAEQDADLVVQTRGPLVTRDIDLFKKFTNVRVQVSITTDSDEIRKQFEPACASIERRIQALYECAAAGIKTTFVMAPMLPMEDPEGFAKRIARMPFEFYFAAPFRFSKGPFAANTRLLGLQIAARLGWSRQRYENQIGRMRKDLPELRASAWREASRV